MKIKHLLLPLAAGLACYATTATARMTPEMQTGHKSSSLHFIENKGQVTDQFHTPRTDIDFKLSGGNGLNIFFGKGKIHYQWSQRTPFEETYDFNERGSAEALEKQYSQPVAMYRLDIELLNASPNPEIITENQQPFFERYFLSWVNTNNSNEGVKANAYKKITYKSIYPNIDWVFYFNGKGQLEHDFIVHPGGKVSDIQIKYSGATSLQLNPDGSLTATTPMGTVKENAPYSYVVQSTQKREEISPLRSAPLHFGRDDGRTEASVTESSVTEALEVLEVPEAPAVISTGAMALRDEMPLRSGEISSYEQSRQQLVASKFILNNNILTFEVAPYSGTLIIDPIVEWGTYFGGSDNETSNALTTDKWGNVYMAGSTSSLSNIVTTGSHQTAFAGGTNTFGADAFLSKWDMDGNLLWATYYGGDKVDVAKGVGCDTAGNVYMGGYSNSLSGISTAGSYQEAKAGIAARYDVFLVRFDTSGQRQWATYYGGVQNEANTSFGLHCDRYDHVLITGNTSSNAGIATPGTYKTSQSDNYDGFLAKFDIHGQVQWGTYYGGIGDDYPQSVTSDSVGNVYITGYTKSLDGISTTNAHQINNGGAEDAFVSKFDNTGQLIWGTYFGDVAQDRGYVIDCNNKGVFIAGITQSTTGIATPNSHQAAFSGGTGGDAFLANFDLEGNIIWSTYYGGENVEAVGGIFINKEGDVYFSGQTQSLNNIATTGSFHESLSGSSDVFLVKFNVLGERQWGTYYGGADIESLGFLTGDKGSNVYLSGYTNSATDIATANSFQNALNGGYDVFLVRFYDCDRPDLPSAISGNTEVCENATEVYSMLMDNDAESYTWILPNGWKGSSDSNSIEVTVLDTDGMIQVVAISACGGISDTQELAITVLPLPHPEIINNNNILSTKQSYPGYQWNKNGVAIGNATLATYFVEANGNYSVTVINEEGRENTSEEIEITDIVGILEAKDFAHIGLYPNPTKDEIKIQSSITMGAEIYSIEGKLIKEHIEITPGINKLDINHLTSGVYFFKFKDGTGQQTTKKFVVK